MFVFVNFFTFKFWFHYFKFCYSIKHLRNKLESSTIGQVGKNLVTAEFLTVANTLIWHTSWNTEEVSTCLLFESAVQQKAAQFPLELNVDDFQGSGG